MSEVLSSFVRDLKRVAPALIDSYFIVDNERKIVDFNRAFYSMFPRQVARGLKNKVYSGVIDLSIASCIVQQCWSENRHVRLDEISGTIVGVESQQMKFIMSAVPIGDDNDQHVGALVILRNVTDEAEVQVKYQEMLETEAQERERLATQIRTRTKELLATNHLLLNTQKELLSYKKGLML